MSDMNLRVATVMADAVAASVLEQVARHRWLRLGDLFASGDVTREAAKEGVRKLQGMEFIDMQQSGLEDFNTVYITADGLAASRKINA